jgi:glycosyltransferase involved in cell wall biosynthesis
MAILYVSYDGALEPLGESQVVAYLERLSRRHALTLLSFEKDADLKDAARVGALAHRLAAAGVRWRPLRYHKQPPVLSTAWDVARGIVVALREARRAPIRVTHARGYVAALIALALRRLVGARFVFDMRGFWPDEKVAAGHWRAGGALYRVGKRCERRFFASADAVVSLTAAGADAVRRLGYVTRPGALVEIIPTCTDLGRFSPGPRDAALAARLGLGPGPVLGCVGSMSNGYLRRPMLDYLARATAAFDTLTVLIVTREDHDWVRAEAVAAGLPSDRLRLTRAPFAEMPRHLRLIDLAVFFIEPTFARVGRAATKLGELLATGVPVIINDGIGDSGRIVGDGRTGIVLLDVTPDSVAGSIPTLGALLDDPDIRQRCRATAERWFDLETGVERYAALYARLDDAAPDERAAAREPAERRPA